ncbi:hypothetical protein RHECNPAF_890015 [Rhizobium etli CNPAF512]|nr:hypothetical protein RHECNPAF_890015 [Rhizobium etli CNPAF512]
MTARDRRPVLYQARTRVSEICLGKVGEFAAVSHALPVKLNDDRTDPLGLRRRSDKAAFDTDLVQHLRQQIEIFRKER